MKKRLFTIILVMFVLMGTTQVAMAIQKIDLANKVPYMENGNPTAEMHNTGFYLKNPPELKGGCSFVPIRMVVEYVFDGLVLYVSPDEILVLPYTEGYSPGDYTIYRTPYYARISLGDIEVQYITNTTQVNLPEGKTIETRTLKGAPYMSEQNELMVPVAVIEELYGCYAEYSNGVLNLHTSYKYKNIDIYGIARIGRMIVERWDYTIKSPLIARKVLTDYVGARFLKVEEPEYWYRLPNADFPYSYYEVDYFSLLGYQDSYVRDLFVYKYDDNAFFPNPPSGYTEYLLYDSDGWYSVYFNNMLEQLSSWDQWEETEANY